MDSVGNRIKRARASLKMSRTELSKLSGVGYSTLAELENGGMRSSTMLHQIAAPLGVSVEYLATGKETKQKSQGEKVVALPSRRAEQRAGGWIGEELTPAQRELVRAVELMARAIPDERAKAIAELVLLSGGAVARPPKVPA